MQELGSAYTKAGKDTASGPQPTWGPFYPVETACSHQSWL